MKKVKPRMKVQKLEEDKRLPLLEPEFEIYSSFLVGCILHQNLLNLRFLDGIWIAAFKSLETRQF